MPRRLKVESTGKTSETGAVSCPGLMPDPRQPSGNGAMPNEGIQGYEWGAYVTLVRTTRTNMGSPTGGDLPMATEAP